MIKMNYYLLHQLIQVMIVINNIIIKYFFYSNYLASYKLDFKITYKKFDNSISHKNILCSYNNF
jgi:hypothetical protein